MDKKDILNATLKAYQFTKYFKKDLLSVCGIENDPVNKDVKVKYQIYGKRDTVITKSAKEISEDNQLIQKFSRLDVRDITKFASRYSRLNLPKSPEFSKEPKYKVLTFLGMLFITFLLVATIMGHRLVDIGGIHLPGAIIIFPLTYFLCDVISEIYGYKRMRQIVWFGIGCQFIFSISSILCMQLPEAAGHDTHAAYSVVLSSSFLMSVGSFLGMSAGFLINSFIVCKLKIKMEGKHLWLRSIGATAIGEAVYTVVWTTVVFHSSIMSSDLMLLQLSMYVVKCLYEVVATPFVYLCVYLIKKYEGIDVYDRYTNFNPFSLAV